MPEIWTDIPGFEGFYKASTLGRIMRINKNTSTFSGKIMKPQITKLGYCRVTLTMKGKRYRKFLHQFICITFNGPQPKGHQINHKDENKGNNTPENLEWCTHQQNTYHSFIRSGKRNHFFDKEYLFKSPTGKVSKCRGLRKFCEIHNLDSGAMSCVARKIYKQHKGWTCVELSIQYK